MTTIDQISRDLDRLLWQTDPAVLASWQRHMLVAARMVHALGRDLTQGYLTLQAMSLVYTTLLSLVPLLAVSFSVLKGLGVHNQIEPILLKALEPLGSQGAEIANTLIGFVDKTQVGVLGSVGLVVLLYSVISLIQKIEQVFNSTWRVERARTFAQRFSRYLSVLLIAPVLFFSAVGATASLRSTDLVKRIVAVEPMGFLVESIGHALPYVLITVAFAFVYLFVPNTRVRVHSALVGALVAGVLWQAVGFVFATFMVGSTKYAAIYSGLAILILFMIWVYIAWLIVLIGANIAFYVQYPEYLATRSRDLRLSNRLRERVALMIGGRIAYNYYTGAPPWSAEALSHAMQLPGTNTERVLGMLETGGFVIQTASRPPCYVPARAPETIRLTRLLAHIRRHEEIVGGFRAARPCGVIADVEQRVDKAVIGALRGMTLKHLADRIGATDQAVVESVTELLPAEKPIPGDDSRID